MNELETHPLIHQTRRVFSTPLRYGTLRETLRVFALAILQSEYFSATLILFGLSFLIFARALLRPNLIVSGSDFTQFYFWEGFTRAELAQWRLPQWNPFFFSGYPFLANPQMMVFYPPAWFLRFFPLDYSFGLGMMLHIGWAGLGMYGLIRNQNMSRAAAFTSGITFMLSGVVITHIKGGHLEWIYTIAWLPWVVWAWSRTLNLQGFRNLEGLWNAIIAGIVTAMMFLAGAARIAAVAEAMVIVLGVWWFATHLTDLRVLKELGGLSGIVLRILIGVIVLIGIAAPQLLPSLEFASLSSRVNGLPLECANNLSITLSDFAFFGLARSPFDQFFEWERNGYVGAMAITLAMIGLINPNRMKWLWIGWGAVGLLLSVGPMSPVYPLARDLIPGLAVIRQPFTFIVMITFALAGLAGLGMERVIESPRRWHIWIAGALLLIVIVFDVMLYRARPQSYDPSFYGWMSWLASFSSPRYLFALLSLWILNWAPHLTGLAEFNTRQIVNRPVRCCRSAMLLTVLYIDLWFFSYIVISILPAPYQLASVPNVFPFEARILTVPYSSADRSMAVRVANAQGYAPVVVKSYNDFVSADRPPSRCPDFEHAEIDSSDGQLLKMLSVSVLDLNGVAKELKDYYPRVAWVGEAVSARTNGEAIKLARAADFDPTKKVIIEGEVNPSTSSGTGSIRVTEYGTESLTVLIDSTSDGWFYVNDVWYPGWKAWVNGEETPIYRANGTFRAVRVPSGQHTVFMQYENTYLSLGIWIALLTWVLIGIVGLFGKKWSQ